MNGWRRHAFWAVMALCCAAICSLSGCEASKPPPSVSLVQIDHYKLSQQKDGLVIAVEPVASRTEMQKYFEENLLKKGILPVLIVAENRNKTQTYLLSPNQIKLIASMDPSGSSLGVAGSDDTRKATYESNFNWAEVAMFGLAGMHFGPTEHSKVVQHNIISKALERKTLAPGQIHSGFMYLKLPRKFTTSEVGLLVPVERIGGGSSLQYEFKLVIPSGASEEADK
jgi:hypothetical protein